MVYLLRYGRDCSAGKNPIAIYLLIVAPRFRSASASILLPSRILYPVRPSIEGGLVGGWAAEVGGAIFEICDVLLLKTQSGTTITHFAHPSGSVRFRGIRPSGARVSENLPRRGDLLSKLQRSCAGRSQPY